MSKGIILSIVSVIALSSLSFAGGKIVEPPKAEVIPIVDDSAFYLGLGYSYTQGNDVWKYASTVIDDDDYTASAFMLQAGYQFNKYFAVEGRYTLSVGDITESHNFSNKPDTDIDMDISNIGIYLKPMYPIGDFTVYGLLGYGQVEMEGVGWSWDDTSFQWGLGASYAINDNFAVFADYTLLYDDDSIPSWLIGMDTIDRTVDAITVGLTYKF